MIRCFILLLYAYAALGIGFDSGGGDRTSCGRPYRAGRLYQPPCDLERLGYCTQAGQLYPWRAVRRFVKDNQGLMRRMYGDQRHGHVLRAELEEDDVIGDDFVGDEKREEGYIRWRPESVRFARYQHHDDINNDLDHDEDLDFERPYVEEGRFLRDDSTNEDVLNTKFVVSEQEAAIAIKLAELKAAAHFKYANQRPAIPTPKATTQKTTPSSTTTPISKTKLLPKTQEKNNTKVLKINKIESLPTLEGSSSTTTLDDINTTKWGNTKGTTETTPTISTEDSTVVTTASSITEEFSEQSSTDDTTTDHTTEWSSKKLSTITRKPTITTTKPTSIKMTLVSNRLKESSDSTQSKTVEKSKIIDKEEDAKENVKSHDGNVESLEPSDVSDIYSDDGDLKTAESSNTPAMLFQDMEEETTKNKAPLDYSNMKGVNACPVKEEVVAPFWANNTRGEVLALLNMYPFEQYVHWEKCTFEHRQMYCREGCRCEQQYRLHRLLAYDPNNECRGIFSDWFRFPSCCVCKCYNMPPEFRVTSRSPRYQFTNQEDQESQN
ncbi:protein spaetzle 4 [Sitophilus oryzae]|uniref:Protein spaetzle 4 n=1 Tax=Sitophilus oryzae TaxID=7048 RepID=A0A6J2Y6R0_SITOR|nr:protein spaetzle 4 [Sitophilus oryzae]